LGVARLGYPYLFKSNTLTMKIRFLFQQLATVLLVAFTISVSGQNTKSTTIRGKVVDAFTGEVLPGATVMLKGTQLGTSADGQGKFKLDGIKGESIVLLVSFIGYESTEFTHALSAKEKQNSLTIKLKPMAEELELVEVTGEALGQVKAMVEQREAVNIKNVVSSEQIDKFPDVSAADVVQRIPGITLQRDQGEGKYIQLRGTPPELTNFNINGEQIPSPEGNVRYVGMDVISANQIDIIEVTKVLTPDMDADGIGGSVNIVTKKASGDKPQINALFSGSMHFLAEATITCGSLPIIKPSLPTETATKTSDSISMVRPIKTIRALTIWNLNMPKALFGEARDRAWIITMYNTVNFSCGTTTSPASEPVFRLHSITLSVKNRIYTSAPCTTITATTKPADVKSMI